MSALEQEIIERLKHLSETAKLNILEVVKQAEQQDDGGYYDDGDEMIITETGELSDDDWLVEMESLRQRIAAEHVPGDFPSAVEMIREIRDEES